MAPALRRAPLARRRPLLLLAFAFAVMADPVSSVAYAIEAALRALDGDLGLLLPTMTMVIAVIVLIIVNYHQIVGRYPQGGGAAAATGEAFGEASAFIPLGALFVDFVLTIAISCAAGASAVIAILPGLAELRPVIAVVLVVAVAVGTLFGHVGRIVFAAMTVAFVVLAVGAVVSGLVATPTSSAPPFVNSGHSAPVAMALAFSVAMALATGIEAPSSAIAQLGQLDDAGRRRFGRVTLWLTLAVVGSLTLGLTAVAVRLGVGVPADGSSQIDALTRASGNGPVVAVFELATALLLLAAASSSFQAGPGLCKALARQQHPDGTNTGILPRWLGRTNAHHTPYWGVAMFLAAAVLVTAVAGGRDQALVLFYAAAVFVAFLAGLLAMCRFSWRERRRSSMVVNVAGVVAVAFTLAVNLIRGEPVIAIAASLLIALGLYALWVHSGRPRGIRNITTDGE